LFSRGIRQRSRHQKRYASLASRGHFAFAGVDARLQRMAMPRADGDQDAGTPNRPFRTIEGRLELIAVDAPSAVRRDGSIEQRIRITRSSG